MLLLLFVFSQTQYIDLQPHLIDYARVLELRPVSALFDGQFSTTQGFYDVFSITGALIYIH